MSATPDQPVQTTTRGVVRALDADPVSDDGRLVEGLRAAEPWARLALFDRFGPHVERLLRRVLGPDPELADALQETFLQAMTSAAGLRDSRSLKPWLSAIAVHTARGLIRRRRVRSWLRFWDPDELPDVVDPSRADSPAREAVHRTYAILATLPANERIAFTLRFVEGMELVEAAEACRCSLATVKRRIDRALESFVQAARGDDVLEAWVERGRWADQ